MLSFVLQAPLAAFCSRVTGFWRVAVMDMFTAFAYVGSVNVWRGLWNLYDIYLFPGAPTEQVANTDATKQIGLKSPNIVLDLYCFVSYRRQSLELFNNSRSRSHHPQLVLLRTFYSGTRCLPGRRRTRSSGRSVALSLRPIFPIGNFRKIENVFFYSPKKKRICVETTESCG